MEVDTRVRLKIENKLIIFEKWKKLRKRVKWLIQMYTSFTSYREKYNQFQRDFYMKIILLQKHLDGV